MASKMLAFISLAFCCLVLSTFPNAAAIDYDDPVTELPPDEGGEIDPSSSTTPDGCVRCPNITDISIHRLVDEVLASTNLTRIINQLVRDSLIDDQTSTVLEASIRTYLDNTSMPVVERLVASNLRSENTTTHIDRLVCDQFAKMNASILVFELVGKYLTANCTEELIERLVNVRLEDARIPDKARKSIEDYLRGTEMASFVHKSIDDYVASPQTVDSIRVLVQRFLTDSDLINGVVDAHLAKAPSVAHLIENMFEAYVKEPRTTKAMQSWFEEYLRDRKTTSFVEDLVRRYLKEESTSLFIHQIVQRYLDEMNIQELVESSVKNRLADDNTQDQIEKSIYRYLTNQTTRKYIERLVEDHEANFESSIIIRLNETWTESFNKLLSIFEGLREEISIYKWLVIGLEITTICEFGVIAVVCWRQR